MVQNSPEQSGAFIARPAHHAIQLGELGLMVSEHRSDQTTVEFDVENKYGADAERRSDHAGITTIFCGDERQLSAESIAHLKELGIEDPEAYLRDWGGILGMADTFAIGLIAQQGEDALLDGYCRRIDPHLIGQEGIASSYPEAVADYDAFIGDFAKSLAIATDGKIRGGNHSATHNEGHQTATLELDHPATDAPGCAAAASKGVVLYYAGTDPANVQSGHDREKLEHVIAISKAEHDTILGINDVRFAAARQAVERFAKLFFGESFTEASYSRTQMIANGEPTAILEGDHVEPEDTKIVMSFDKEEISRPRKAHEADLPTFRNDTAAIVSLVADQMFPELHLKKDIMAAIKIIVTTAVKAALTNGQPERYRTVVRGNPAAFISGSPTVTTV